MWTYTFLVYTILKERGIVPSMERLSGGGDTPLSAPLYTLLYVYSYTYFFYKSIHGVNFDSLLYYICFIIIMGRNSTVVVTNNNILNLSPPWCLTPPLLWWGSTHPPWIGILAHTIFAAIVNTPLSYYLWNFGTNDKFSPPPSNPGVENLSTWSSDTWSSGTYMSQNSTCQKSTCWDSVLPKIPVYAPDV